MDMAKAYDDYWVSRRSGWTHMQSLDHACYVWGVDREDFILYLLSFD